MSDKMAIEDAQWWAKALVENLLDYSYNVALDTETHFKIAAVRRLIERNEELENALQLAQAAREQLGKAIGPVL